MKSVMIAASSLTLLIYLGFGFYLYVFQRNLLYHPTPPVTSDDYAAITVNGLKIWRVNPGQPQSLVYFGGNKEGVEHNLDDYENMFPDYTLYFVNYRGFGGSSGSPSEAGFYEDALAVYDQLSGYKTIAVVGRSLGSGVATYLAANRKVDKLVLVTPYDSIVAVAQNLYPLYPANFLLRDKFESTRYAGDTDADVLIVIAALDQVIPPKHAYQLAEQFPEGRVKKVFIEDANHNGIHNNTTYRKTIQSFLSTNLSG